MIQGNLKNSFSFGLLIFLLGIPLAISQGRSAYARPGTDPKSWAISNDLRERVIRFDPNTGLRTTSWRNKRTGTEFMKLVPQVAATGGEFVFAAGGKQYVGGARGTFDFVSDNIADVAPRGKELRILLRSHDQLLTVTVHYVVYEGHPVIRKWIEIKNESSGPIALPHLAFEAVNLVPAAPADLQVSAYYGLEPRELFFTGRVDDPAITVRNSRSGEGYIVLNEAPGYLKRTEAGPWFGEGMRAMHDTDLFPFRRTLAPRESFVSAKSSVALFQEGAGTTDPHWLMPSYTSAVLMKKGSVYQPPWIFNALEPFGRGIDLNTVREEN